MVLLDEPHSCWPLFCRFSQVFREFGQLNLLLKQLPAVAIGVGVDSGVRRPFLVGRRWKWHLWKLHFQLTVCWCLLLSMLVPRR